MIVHSRTYVAAPPGFTIKELIDDRGISEAQLADAVAARLEAALGMRASFWVDYERLYRETLDKVAAENA